MRKLHEVQADCKHTDGAREYTRKKKSSLGTGYWAEPVNRLIERAIVPCSAGVHA